MIFLKLFREELTESRPHSISLRSRFRHHPRHPLYLFPLQMGDLIKHYFPQPVCPRPNSGPISFQDYVAGLKFTVDRIHDSRLELRTFWKSSELIIIGIIAPNASILVQNAP